MPRTKSSQPMRCSFCDKSQDEVAKLISSPSHRSGLFICEECVAVCNDILRDDAQATTPDSATVLRTSLEEATLPPKAVVERIAKLEGKSRQKSHPNELPERRVVLGVGISLDGYIARPDGSVDFLFMPKDYSMASFLANVDTAVMGRKTYDVAVGLGGSFGGKTKTYVFSHSQPSGVRNHVTFTNQVPAALIAELRQHPGKHIWLMGGGELAREFLKADLVDGLYIGIVPVVLGEGIPLFPSGFPQRDFTLLENKTYSKGLIGLRYERKRTKAKGKS